MLGASAANGADRAPSRSAAHRRRRQGRVLAACIAIAVDLHLAFLGEVAVVAPRAPGATAPLVSVREVAAVEPPEAAVDAPVEAPPAVAASPAVVAKKAPQPRTAREPARSASRPADSESTEASARIDEGSRVPPEAVASAPMAAETAAPAAETPAAGTPVVADAATAPPAVDAARHEAEARAPATAAPAPAEPTGESSPPPLAAGAPPPPLVAAGESPPPVYPTRLPPSATLRYQVRRGLLRGTGEIRWRVAGDTYELALEARIAGLTLLRQASEGGVDAAGLAPVRFLDQRARRPAQAANFRRDLGTIGFSGPTVEWPLLAGSQDRLSWMIQLAAIAAAAPERLVEGARIAMVVVGARGDASVWTLRCAGRENVETAAGSVLAVKLVRDGRSTYDSSAEIWLDPERDYFPAHATLRNSAGSAEYDLLLERVDPPT